MLHFNRIIIGQVSDLNTRRAAMQRDEGSEQTGVRENLLTFILIAEDLVDLDKSRRNIHKRTGHVYGNP